MFVFLQLRNAILFLHALRVPYIKIFEFHRKFIIAQYYAITSYSLNKTDNHAMGKLWPDFHRLYTRWSPHTPSVLLLVLFCFVTIDCKLFIFLTTSSSFLGGLVYAATTRGRRNCPHQWQDCQGATTSRSTVFVIIQSISLSPGSKYKFSLLFIIRFSMTHRKIGFLIVWHSLIMIDNGGKISFDYLG